MPEENPTSFPVVVHYANGTILKCYALGTDVGPTHVLVTTNDGTSYKIKNKDLKAVFFVRTLLGDDRYNESRKFPPGFSTGGQKIGVRFKDGERVVGVSHDYDPKKQGFHMVPADAKSNNLRIYVVRSFLDDCVLLH